MEGKPPAAGAYRWTLVVDAPSVQDRHDLGEVTVYANDAGARAAAEHAPAEDATAIAYLKEQQWTNEFATAPVREGELRRVIRVPAALQPLTGLLRATRQVQHHAGMQVLEDRIPFRTGELVDAGHRALDVAGAVGGALHEGEGVGVERLVGEGGGGAADGVASLMTSVSGAIANHPWLAGALNQLTGNGYGLAFTGLGTASIAAAGAGARAWWPRASWWRWVWSRAPRSTRYARLIRWRSKRRSRKNTSEA